VIDFETLTLKSFNLFMIGILSRQNHVGLVFQRDEVDYF
jgi:hypothetical protein